MKVSGNPAGREFSSQLTYDGESIELLTNNRSRWGSESNRDAMREFGGFSAADDQKRTQSDEESCNETW
jgi:hypothetical protein